MSSRFISSGAIDTKTGDVVPVEEATPSTSSPATATTTTKKSDEWAAVQAQLEADRLQRQRAREEAAANNASGGGAASSSSLYDVLQANKAAKQAAFEEANKIKNQFRPLDDDEVEFLDEVRTRRREEEERLRRETEEGLRAFRERQRLVEVGAEGEGGGEEGGVVQEGTGGGGGAGAGAGADSVVAGGWSVSRKRKRRRDDHAEGIIKGLKRREGSNAGGAGLEGGKTTGAEGTEEEELDSAAREPKATTTTTTTTTTTASSTTTTAADSPPLAKSKAGLVDYGSDDDSD